MSILMRYQPATAPRQMGRTKRSSLSPTAGMALVQGIYFFLTGIWPLVSIDTFELVTGPKTDHWLVQTVGAVIAVIGAVLIASVWRRWATLEIVVLAMGSAAALIAIDVLFVYRQIIPQIYLLDAGVEGLLIALWLVALAFESRTLWKRSRTCL